MAQRLGEEMENGERSIRELIDMVGAKVHQVQKDSLEVDFQSIIEKYSRLTPHSRATSAFVLIVNSLSEEEYDEFISMFEQQEN